MSSKRGIRVEPPYNPLDKKNLGVSVADAMLERPVEKLPPEEPFIGAGIYAIYYVGNFPAYKPIAEKNVKKKFAQPIYVGKAVPKGARIGGALDPEPGNGPLRPAAPARGFDLAHEEARRERFLLPVPRRRRHLDSSWGNAAHPALLAPLEQDRGRLRDP